MDTVTQAALGAAIGEAVLGRKIGGKAALYGAIIATLPDLDVFVPFGGPVATFTYHRSFSHSLFVLTAVAPVVAVALHRFRKDTPDLRTRWIVMTFLALFTHPLLDSFTIYGTQLFWPLTEYPYALGSIFIIDPLYTLPLLIGVIATMVIRRRTLRQSRANTIGLAASSAYLIWSVIAQSIATDVARNTMAAENIPYRQMLTSPAPFSTVLWRTTAIAPDGSTYTVGYDSLFDGADRMTVNTYRADQDRAVALAGHWPADRLRWFTKGFYRTELSGSDVVLSDLRMGSERGYVFIFRIGQEVDGRVAPAPDVRVPPNRDLSGSGKLWHRIWNAKVDLRVPENRLD